MALPLAPLLLAQANSAMRPRTIRITIGSRLPLQLGEIQSLNNQIITLILIVIIMEETIIITPILARLHELEEVQQV